MDRRRQALPLLAEARGESPPETIKRVEVDRQRAEAELVGARERTEALRTVEREVQEEVDRVEDAHPGHFQAKAEARAAALEEKRAKLVSEATALVAEGRANAAEWGNLRRSAIRGGRSGPREVLVSDLGGAASELAKWSSYPGGSKQAWEQSRADQARQTAAEVAPKSSSREARAWVEAV